jgi:exonuclease III
MRRIALALICLCFPAHAETTLRVMSFNAWGGGAKEGKGVEETVAAIRAAGADSVGLQETRVEPDPRTPTACAGTGPSVAPAIAAALGWHYHDKTQQNGVLWANSILSRYPIGPATPNGLGVPVDVNGITLWMFNIHLDDEPYQPYQPCQLLGIEYGPAPFVTTEAEAIRFAGATRGPAMDLLAQDMTAAEGAAGIFVTGDVNEPSGLDWTGATVTAGQHPVAVNWPTTRRLTDAGFIDTYRAIFPDPVAKPAFTWSPRSDGAATDDHPDRIDVVLARGNGLTVTGAAIVGEDGPRSDRVVMPWPSDHRAVVAEVRF